MRRVIVAALALSPMLLHAQANSPAKTQSNGTASTLQAELGRPNAFNAAVDTTHSVKSAATPLRVSSGVVAPKLVYSVDVSSEGAYVAPSIRKTYVVELTVDTNGAPSDMKVIHSDNAVMSRNVLEALRQYRFKPGTLDNQPINFPVSLEVVVKSPEL
jgi:TonB family protein